MRVAVIPARGGSKRVPGKNIRNFHGKPMIAWAIEACLQSNCFDKIIVSTDDAEIAKVSNQFGAQVPFTRPAELSDDHSTTLDVMAHAANQLLESGDSPKYLCCVYATAPFLEAADIAMGREKIESGNWEYAFAVTEFNSSIFRGFVETNGGGLKMLYPEFKLTRSQDLQRVFHDAAQFYWGTTAAWKNKKDVFAEHSTPIEIPSWRVQDIDTEDDFKRAELMFKLIRNKSENKQVANYEQ